MRLKIMTFNVRGSFHNDGINDWDERCALNVATILRHSPDVIGFQEAQRGNLTTYEDELAGYAFELGALSIRQTEGYHRVPIFWKAGLFEEVDHGSFYLSETPDRWSIGWNATFARAATWVRLRAHASQSELVILNTHFPHEPEADTARTESAWLVVRQLEKLTGDSVPVVVMADFNALPTSEAYQVFTQHGYQDTYTANGSRADANTFHDFRGPAYPCSSHRIDWILTRDGASSFAVRDCAIITDAAPPLYPSDHYPVLAKLDLA